MRVFTKFISLLLWVFIVYFCFDVQKDTSPFFDDAASVLISFSFIQTVLEVFQNMGYQSVRIEWLATKLYFITIIISNFTIVALFFTNRKATKRLFYASFTLIIISFIFSIISRITGNSYFQHSAYSLLTIIIYPIAPLLFIPIFYMLSLEKKHLTDVEIRKNCRYKKLSTKSA